MAACFTVQEEIGLRGAEVAAWHIEPDMAVVIEGTTCADIPDVPEHMHTTRMGAGPSISFMDHSSIAHPRLFKQMVETAEKHSIPYQIKENIAGATMQAASRYHVEACHNSGFRSLPLYTFALLYDGFG